MMKTVDLQQKRAMAALLRVLPEELHPEADGTLVTALLGDESWRFLPIWIGEGLPADARRSQAIVLERIALYPDAVPVVVANRVSPGAQELLRENHLSWADRRGRARIHAPQGLFVSRFDPVSPDVGRAFRWSNAADAVAETLLTWAALRNAHDASRIDRVGDIAAATDLSLAHTATVLRRFDDLGYTAKTGAERGTAASREFRDPGRMLSDWAAHAAAGGGGQTMELHVPWRETDQSLKTIHEALDGMTWAVTGTVAADLIAPFLTSITEVELYVSDDDADRARRLLLDRGDLTEVESGGRVRVRTAAPRVLRLAREIHEVQGVHIVSPVRVYADLLRRGGRSAEAAEHLREVVIGF